MKHILLIFAILFNLVGHAHAQITICAGATTMLTSTPPTGTWSSSSPAIATVDSSDGILTGVSAGIATIAYTTGSVITSTSVTVNPMPRLTSTLTPPDICDSTVFHYMPTSTITGTSFAWSQPYIPGILPWGAMGSAAGIGDPREEIVNTTYVPVYVTFIYTLSANGCTDSEYAVSVIVYPTPKLTGILTPASICDSSLFVYIPTSFTPGASFAWSRPAVAGITPSTSSGTDSVHEVLYDTTAGSEVVTYEFRLGIGTCINSSLQPVNVTVDPCSFREAVNSISNPAETINVYPNPSYGSFTVELPQAGKTTITISDIAGKVIETRNAAGGTGKREDFNLDNLPTGTYLIKAIADGQVYREKVVIW